jgi:hypothetical protein
MLATCAGFTYFAFLSQSALMSALALTTHVFVRRHSNSLAATVAEGLGKLLMHNHIWGQVGIGSLEQGDAVKVCRRSATRALLCACY